MEKVCSTDRKGTEDNPALVIDIFLMKNTETLRNARCWGNIGLIENE